MTFNAQIPQAGDSISASQPPILTNFTQLDALFGLDHVRYTDATQAARGRHTKITFNDLSANPGLAKPISSLYTKGPVGGPMNLFFQNDTLISNIVQLTGLTVTSVGNGGTAGGTQYVIETPWGLRIFCGETLSKSNGPFSVTFPAGSPITVLYYYSATPANNVIRSVNCSGNVAGLSVIYGGNATAATWIAIGKI